MIRQGLAFLLVLGLTAPALADLTEYNEPLQEKFITLHADGSVTVDEDRTSNPQDAFGTWYSSLAAPGGYSAFGPATGPVGFDDYQSTSPDPILRLTSFRFVGGVQDVGGIATFDFFDATGTSFVNSFSVALPSAGDFIWTITLGGVDIDANGVVQMSVDAGTAPTGGRFFLHDDPVTIGSNDNMFGGANGGAFVHAFELTGLSRIPEPTSALLLMVGMGGFAMIRRR